MVLVQAFQRVCLVSICVVYVCAPSGQLAQCPAAAFPALTVLSASPPPPPPLLSAQYLVSSLAAKWELSLPGEQAVMVRRPEPAQGHAIYFDHAQSAWLI